MEPFKNHFMKDYYQIIIKLVLAGLAYFAEIQNLFHAVLVFMAIDWVTGVYASFKYRSREIDYINDKPTKRPWFVASKMRYSIEKFVFYMLAIAMAYVFRKEFIEGIYLAKIVAGYIAITELKSIFENISRIMGVKIFNEIWGIIKNQFNNKFNIDSNE